MYFKIKNPKTKGILSEILGRMDLIEVKGQSVEHLYMIQMGLKQIIESMEEVKEESEKEKSEDKKEV